MTQQFGSVTVFLYKAFAFIPSRAAEELGALSESGGTTTAEPFEEQRSPATAALQPLVQTLLCWLLA